MAYYCLCNCTPAVPTLLPKSSRKFSVSKDLTSTQSLTKKPWLYPYFGGYHSKFSTFASTYHHWQMGGQMHSLNELLEAYLYATPTMHSRDMFPNLIDLRVTWRKSLNCPEECPISEQSLFSLALISLHWLVRT